MIRAQRRWTRGPRRRRLRRPARSAPIASALYFFPRSPPLRSPTHHSSDQFFVSFFLLYAMRDRVDHPFLALSFRSFSIPCLFVFSFPFPFPFPFSSPFASLVRLISCCSRSPSIPLPFVLLFIFLRAPVVQRPALGALLPSPLPRRRTRALSFGDHRRLFGFCHRLRSFDESQRSWDTGFVV